MSPPRLVELQRWMHWMITDPRGAQALAEDGAAEGHGLLGTTQWQEVLVPVHDGHRARRLEVYSDAYPARLAEALAETFETLRRVLGEGPFNGLCVRYLAVHPPCHANLTRAGDALASYLEQDALTTELPFLPDLARLERGIMASFHVHARSPLDPQLLAALSADRFAEMRIDFQPHVFTLRSPWPVRSLRERRRGTDEDLAMPVIDHAEDCVVSRVGLNVVLRAPAAGELPCLEALLAGATVGDALDSVEADHRDGIGAWFASWMADALVTGLR